MGGRLGVLSVAGRPESPLDASAGPVARFAAELRKLRSEAGSPTYRVMAQRTGQGASTLSQAAAGERLPTLPVALAYVRACGGDPAEWEERWRQTSAELAAEPRSEEEDAEPPYRGLARFEPADAGLFFGRDELADRLLSQARSRRVTALFGPSGSGKSSLLRAGLIPRLRDPHESGPRPAAVRVLTPGEHPLRTHARHMVPADGDGDTWLIVDQFEELYTLCTDPGEREAFIGHLLAAAGRGSRLRVVIAVRADFLGHCARHAGLTAALQDGTVLAGPMSREELREAVVAPAQKAGLIVERALTARVLDEVEDEPGALPLMSHALLETWRRRKGRALTMEAYEAAGGLRGAIARTAEDAYARFAPAQADLARRILLRLITPGGGTPDTRRPVARTELDFGEPGDVTEVLERLTRARMLTVDADTVDLAHEALITAWPRLAAWIEEDRGRLRIHRQVTQDAAAWQDLDRDPSLLYRGTRLAAAEDAFPAPDRQRDLTAPEAAFLDAAVLRREQERLSAARSATRLRALVVSLAVLVVLALVAGVIAWQQNLSSERRRTEADARTVAAVADNMRSTDPVRAMRLSLAAWSLSHTTETRSSLLAAWTQKEQDHFTVPGADSDSEYGLTPDGRVLVTLDDHRVTTWDTVSHRTLWSHPVDPRAQLDGITPDGRTVAVDARDGLQIWDTSTSGGQWVPPDRGRVSAALGDSGRTLVTWSAASPDTLSVKLWNRRTHHLLFQRRIKEEELPGVLTSPDDRLVALCPHDASPEVWDLADGRQLPLPSFIGRLRDDPCGTQSIRFSPRGQRLAAATDSSVRTWDFSSRRELPALAQPGATGIQFSGDGTLLAAASGSTIDVWRTTAPDTPVFRYTAVNEEVNDLRMDTASRTLRYVGGAGLGQPTVIRTLRLGPVLDPAWAPSAADTAILSPDGRTLAALVRHGNSGRLRLLNTAHSTVTADIPVPYRTEDNCSASLAFSGDARLLAYAPPACDQDAHPIPVTLWDSRTRVRLTRDLPPSDRRVSRLAGLALTADGRYLLVSWGESAQSPGAVDIWSTGSGRRTRVVRGADGLPAVSRDGTLVTSYGHVTNTSHGPTHHMNLSEDNVGALAFSDDGKRLAAADDSGRVDVWDMTGRRRTGILVGPFGSGPQAQGDGSETISSLVFSHDGSTLAVGGDEGTLQLWDVASSRRLGLPLPTSGDAVQSVAFGPGDDTLYVAAAHLPVGMYSVAGGPIAAAVCARAGGGPSRDDWATYLPDRPYKDVCGPRRQGW
jgi:WD40 repeat protein